MNWYKESQQEIDYEKALSTEKWIISIAKYMYKVFDEINNRGDYNKYMKRITPLVRTLKIYIDKLKGYPTVSQGADRQVVEMAKNNIGNLTSLNSHDVSNNLQGLFSAVDLAI